MLRDRKLALLSMVGVVYLAGLAIEAFFLPHYLAAATALLYATLLQCMRHLRVWRPAGLMLVRATPVLCVSLALLRVFAHGASIELAPERNIVSFWYGTSPLGLDRARIAEQLE